LSFGLIQNNTAPEKPFPGLWQKNKKPRVVDVLVHPGPLFSVYGLKALHRMNAPKKEASKTKKECIAEKGHL